MGTTLVTRINLGSLQNKIKLRLISQFQEMFITSNSSDRGVMKYKVKKAEKLLFLARTEAKLMKSMVINNSRQATNINRIIEIRASLNYQF